MSRNFIIYGIILIIAIILWQSKSAEMKEDFYTLFTPYYYPDALQKYKTYSSQRAIPDLRKVQLTLWVEPRDLKNTHLHLFLKSFIAYKYPIVRINLINTNNIKYSIDQITIINKINSGEADLGITSGPVLYRHMGVPPYGNLSYLASLNDQYIFIIARIDNGTDILSDLAGRRIGIGEQGGLWNYCAMDVFDFGYTPFFGGLNEMLDGLRKNRLDAILITDAFPSQLLSYIFYNYYGLHLISLKDTMNKTSYYTKVSIDLNRIGAIYLPQATFAEKKQNWVKMRFFNRDEAPKKWRSFNNYSDNWKTFYNPDFTTFRFSNYLIGNSRTITPEVGYMLVKHIFDNKDLLKKSIVPFTFLQIPINEGARRFYYEKGYMSNIESDKCIYLYGKDRCTRKNLREKELDISLYYNLL